MNKSLEPRTEEIKRRIMNAATLRFSKFGFSKTTTAEIALDLSISKKTIYKYFRTKEDILLETAAMHLGEVEKQINIILTGSDLPALGKFFTCMRFIAQKVMDLGPMIRGLEQAPQDLRNSIMQTRHHLIHDISGRLLDAAIKEGKIRPDVDVTVFSIVLMTIIDNVFIPEMFTKLQYSAITLFRQVFGIMMSGILTPEATTEYRKMVTHQKDNEGE